MRSSLLRISATSNGFVSIAIIVPFQRLREFDVARLRRLVAAAGHYHDDIAAPDEIDPISMPIVDSKFAHAVAHRRPITKIPLCDALKTPCNFGHGPRVAQATEP